MAEAPENQEELRVIENLLAVGWEGWITDDDNLRVSVPTLANGEVSISPSPSGFNWKVVLLGNVQESPRPFDTRREAKQGAKGFLDKRRRALMGLD